MWRIARPDSFTPKQRAIVEIDAQLIVIPLKQATLSCELSSLFSLLMKARVADNRVCCCH